MLRNLRSNMYSSTLEMDRNEIFESFKKVFLFKSKYCSKYFLIHCLVRQRQRYFPVRGSRTSTASPLPLHTSPREPIGFLRRRRFPSTRGRSNRQHDGPHSLSIQKAMLSKTSSNKWHCKTRLLDFGQKPFDLTYLTLSTSTLCAFYNILCSCRVKLRITKQPSERQSRVKQLAHSPQRPVRVSSSFAGSL